MVLIKYIIIVDAEGGTCDVPLGTNLYQRRSNWLYHEFTDSKNSVEIHSDLNVK